MAEAKHSEFFYDHQRPLDLISMGRVAVDLYAEQIGSPLEDVQSFRKYLGGCAGNIAVGTARLGLKSSMLSCVGEDHMGMFVKKTLQKEGVVVDQLRETPDHLTGLVLLGVSPPDHFPLIFYRNSCADMQLSPDDVQPSKIAESKALLVTGTGLSHPQSRETTLYAMKMAREVGTRVILDIDYRPVLWGLTATGDGETRYQADSQVSQVFFEALPWVDLVVGTEEEIRIAGGSDHLQGALKVVLDLSGSPVVMKTGEKGCEIYFSIDQPSVQCAPYPVKILNVLGAGDGFLSGFLSALLTGKSWHESGLRGNGAGAMVVSRHGCAPAIPSLPELQYFQKNYESTGDRILKSSEVLGLHRQTELKEDGRQDHMFVMAFCHRWQFEESCQTHDKPYQLINEFKQQIFCAFREANKNLSNDSHGWILTDPQYGQTALQEALRERIPAIVPIEKSGEDWVQWLEPTSAYDILVQRPQEWGVKVLWKYHPHMDHAHRLHQLHKLQELQTACQRLERRLMVELIVPNLASSLSQGQVVADVMATVYQSNISPYWWKLQPMESSEDWHHMSQVIDEFGGGAKVLVLGGGRSAENFEKSFSVAQMTDHGIGFAIGRSIFWSSWLKFLSDPHDVEAIRADMKEKYLKLCEGWLAQGKVMGKDSLLPSPRST